MLLTITTTYQPATDLGYLLYKHPARVQRFELNFGQAHVFYPEATATRCTAALLLDIDPVGLVRRGAESGGFALAQYVNDRPYVASSLLSVAIGEVYGSALAGTCRDRPELAETPIPLTAVLAVVPARGGEDLLYRLFAPLGYTVTAQRHPLDVTFPAWGESVYYTVTLRATVRLHELLSHLYVLIPVLDDDKHYYVGNEEVEKLLRHGAGWLATHPARELITQRYLRHQRSLKRAALARLVEETPQVDEADSTQDAEEERIETQVQERQATLHELRLDAVLAALKAAGAQRVLDLGCGEGRLLALLLKEKSFTTILGADVSTRALEIAADRLHLDRLPPRQRERITLLHSSLIYRDERLAGFDAAAIVEVIEHLDPPRLAAFERVLFECARPQTVVLTTPNAEYNVMWPTLPAGRFRHRDHRFEWTRAEFAAWCQQVADRFGYSVTLAPIGPVDETVGAPSQMGVFTRL
ncbi:MAG: 3' terminal RNA ribose 2'-O-methyltransferase Hen1 [Caldilinea sp. CFX5]|nr:3' terminal RNA ribose 2'-O-methyltransferase Hen1 [Caldilinea sp. CFX5]